VSFMSRLVVMHNNYSEFRVHLLGAGDGYKGPVSREDCSTVG